MAVRHGGGTAIRPARLLANSFFRVPRFLHDGVSWREEWSSVFSFFSVDRMRRMIWSIVAEVLQDGASLHMPSVVYAMKETMCPGEPEMCDAVHHGELP